MTRIPAVVVAVLVVTAFVGGFAGVAAGTAPNGGTIAQPDATAQPGVADAHADVEAPTCEFPLTVTDATGEEITLEEPPERIVTTNPSAAQVLWEFGAQDRVVGLTQFAAYLDGAFDGDVERVNVSADPGVDNEKIVGADPDVVLAPNATGVDDTVQPLRDAGLTVYHFHEAQDVDDIADKTDLIGQLVGECEAAAETNAWMYDEVDAVEERTADYDRPTALYPLGSGFVAAGDTFIDEIMTIGGVENVAAAEHVGYPQLSPEVVIEADPELILVIDRTAGILDEEPYSQTTAGIEGNAVEMQVHYLNQPAPRSVVESTNTLADAVEAYFGSDADEGAGADDDAADGDDGIDGDDETPDTPVEGDDDATSVAAPGFGVAVTALAALIAALSATLLARRP